MAARTARRAERLRAAVVACTVALATFGCGPGDEALFGRADGIVRGTILDGLEPSQPIGQARVQLLGVESASRFSQPDGTFEIRDVAPGLYDLVADREVLGANRRVRLRFVEVIRGQTIDLPDLELEVPGSVSGTALLTGAGPGNPVAPSNIGVRVELIGTTLSALTDAAGAWAMPVVEQSEYSVRFSRDGFEDQVLHGVSVASGANTVVATVTLPRLDPPQSAILRGRAVLEAFPGDDFAGVTVRLDGTTRTLTTTTGGFWEFRNVPVGTYDVSFTHPDYFEARRHDVLVVSGLPVNETGDTVLSNHRVLNPMVTASGIAVAPSRNQIAYITNNGNSSEVGLLSPSGVAFNQILTSGARAAAGRGIEWFPGERDILFTRFVGSGTGAFAPAIVDDVGSNVRTLLTSGTDYFMGTFSPDGDEMAFYLTESLLAVDIARDSMQRTIAVTASQRVVAPGLGQLTELNGIEWSNTGRIVYDAEAGTAAPDDLFTVLASGSFAPQRLGPRRRDPPDDTGAALAGRFSSPTFSPDFARVAFSVEPGGAENPGIYVVDVDGENAMQISSDPGNFLDWVPGGQIYYVGLADSRPAVLKVPSMISPR